MTLWKRGFSLVELLVATTIFGLIVVSVAPIESYLLRQCRAPAARESAQDAAARLAPQFEADVRRARAG